MSVEREKNVIEQTDLPITKEILINDLKTLGLKAKDIVIFHCSLSKIGWIIGGEITLIHALMEVVTKDGTIIMPAQSGSNTDPANWCNPPVPEKWWQIIRENMPAFDPEITPTRGLGRTAELFRKFPGVLRSNHPQCSFTAWGKNAKEIIKNHPLTPCFGVESPLGKLYEINAKVLLLGVDHGNNTALHLAECMGNFPQVAIQNQGAAVLENGKQKWIEFQDIDYNDEDFSQLGLDYEQLIGYTVKNIGNASSRLLDLVPLIDFGIKWLEDKRK